MFKVGDKVVHPAHGAGIVTAIEMVDVLDEFNRYYVINPIASDMKLMVPVRMAEEIGLRPAVKLRDALKALDFLGEQPSSLPGDYKERQALIEERLRNADLVTVVKIVRDLSWLQWEDRLTAKDITLLGRARQLLVGELAVAANMGLEEAERKLQTALERELIQRTTAQT